MSTNSSQARCCSVAFCVGTVQREYHGCRRGVRPNVGVSVHDGVNLSCLFVVELIETMIHCLDVAPPLTLLIRVGEQLTLRLGFFVLQSSE